MGKYLTVIACYTLAACLVIYWAAGIKNDDEDIYPEEPVIQQLSMEVDVEDTFEELVDIEVGGPEVEEDIQEEVVEEKPYEKYDWYWYTKEDAEMIAKMVWGEARGVKPMVTSDGISVSTEAQWAAVTWTVLNRYDAGYGLINIIVTAPRQYVGYRESNPVDERILAVVEDVLERWVREKNGETDVGRVLPSGYLWFHGNDGHNHFRNEFESRDEWNWSLPDVYA